MSVAISKVAISKMSAAIVDLQRKMDELEALRRAVYRLNALRNRPRWRQRRHSTSARSAVFASSLNRSVKASSVS
jgi:hypothetical protein